MKANLKYIGKEKLYTKEGKSKEFYKYSIRQDNKVEFIWIKGNQIILSTDKLLPGPKIFEITNKISSPKDGYNFIKRVIVKGKELYKQKEEDLSSKILRYTAIASSLITVVFMTYGLIQLARKASSNMYRELEADKAEKLINNELYKNEKIDDKEFLEFYGNVINAINDLLHNPKRNGIIIGGKPGFGKTYVVRRQLYLNKVKYTYLKGSSTSLRSLLTTIYENPNQLIVFDDFDYIIKDEQAIDVIRAITDTYEKRIIHVPSNQERVGQDVDVSYLPSKFVFKGKIIIITNLSKEALPPSLISRTGYINVDFKSERAVKLLMAMIKHIAKDVDEKKRQEILAFTVQLAKKTKQEPSLRLLQNIYELSKLYPDWKKVAISIYS